MKTTCGHNCHLLRTGLECSPCKFKPQTDTTMNYEIQRLKEIIIEKDKTIEGYQKALESSVNTNQNIVKQYVIDNRPKQAIETAIMFIDLEIIKARQRNKQVLKDLKKMLQYESTERTIAAKN